MTPGLESVSDNSAGPDAPPSLVTLRHLARHQVMGLATVFLLGMAVNLIGLPSQVRGAAHVASIAFLAAHVLVAVGLVAGTVMVQRAASRLRGRYRRQAITGTAAVTVAVVAGILTLIIKSNWWSYLMAVGFIAALLANGSLLLPTTAASSDGNPQPESGPANDR
jgi:hypothetical protein